MSSFIHSLSLFPSPAEANTSGPWRATANLQDISVQFTGLDSGDSLLLQGSNYIDPSDDPSPDTIGSPITADGIVRVDQAPRWLRASITFSGGSGGPLSALLSAREDC